MLTTVSLRFMLVTLFGALVFASMPTMTAAQVLYGSLVGNVTDPKGAAVTGAKVELTNVATGVLSTITTDDRGSYALNDLQVGVYKMAISRASFKTTLKEDVRIEANKTYRFDAQLEIGGVEETVLVAATQDATLQTDRAGVTVTQSARDNASFGFITATTGPNQSRQWRFGMRLSF